MGGMHLAIDQAAVLGAQVRNPVCQGEFGSIVLPGKHRLPKENTAKSDTVEATYNFSFCIALYTLGDPKSIQSRIPFDKVIVYPAPVLALSGNHPTRVYYFIKITVDFKLKI